MKLFLKGTRCHTAKCTFERRQSPPGMHGRSRRGKLSEYAVQLREKQKLRRMYGLLERQFHIFFQRANRMKGVTGDNLLIMLESRLDNVVYRAGFAPSRAMARQMVNHALITVNGRRVDIPSFIVGEGDIIGCRDNERVRNKVKGAFEELGEGYIVPEWIDVDREGLRATIARAPVRADITATINESHVVELYSK